MADFKPDTDLLVVNARFLGLLERIALDKRPCRLCGAILYVVQTRDRPKPIYVTKDGNLHVPNTCPKYLEHKARPKQGSLLPGDEKQAFG